MTGKSNILGETDFKSPDWARRLAQQSVNHRRGAPGDGERSPLEKLRS